MNHTIEDSKGRQIVCAGYYEKEYEKRDRKGYTIQEGNYNKKDVVEVDVLNIQEIKVNDGLTTDKFIINKLDGQLANRKTQHAIDILRARGIEISK